MISLSMKKKRFTIQQGLPASEISLHFDFSTEGCTETKIEAVDDDELAQSSKYK